MGNKTGISRATMLATAVCQVMIISNLCHPCVHTSQTQKPTYFTAILRGTLQRSQYLFASESTSHPYSHCPSFSKRETLKPQISAWLSLRANLGPSKPPKTSSLALRETLRAGRWSSHPPTDTPRRPWHRRPPASGAGHGMKIIGAMEKNTLERCWKTRYIYMHMYVYIIIKIIIIVIIIIIYYYYTIYLS